MVLHSVIDTAHGLTHYVTHFVRDFTGPDAADMNYVCVCMCRCFERRYAMMLVCINKALRGECSCTSIVVKRVRLSQKNAHVCVSCLTLLCLEKRTQCCIHVCVYVGMYEFIHVRSKKKVHV